MSAFAAFASKPKPSQPVSSVSAFGGGNSGGGSSGKRSSGVAAQMNCPPVSSSSKKARAAKQDSSDDSDGGCEEFLPRDDSDDADPALSTTFGGVISLARKQKVPARVKCAADLDGEEHDYIRDRCLVPSEYLKTFGEVVGARAARCFAEQYRPVSSGASRAMSGLLLFGPSGTGKSLISQAICSYIGGTMYQLSAADLPNGKAGAMRIDALFDVALAGDLPAVIFIDECDTVLGVRAASRVGHFAGRFERFTNNLLVIGATNEPDRIAPKILTGRFERKIFVDNPSPKARLAMIQRQLAEEPSDHALTSADLDFIVEKTAGRSAVNMERLISSASIHAAGAPVCRDDFLTALEEEPSDFDKITSARNAKFDKKYGWHPM